MIPNTITMFCLVIQAQLAREMKEATEISETEPKEVEMVQMDPEDHETSHEQNVLH